jgi:hypothetical protein
VEVLKLKLDLHVHTEYSQDSNTSIEEIVRRCCEVGLDGYAITDHDTINGLPEALAKKSGLIVIPGIEISSRGCHILALGINDQNKEYPNKLSMLKTVEFIHEFGGLAILAHPYGLPRSWVNSKEVREAEFDAIEVANSAQIPYHLIERLNRNLAKDLNLPTTGGSDSHILSTIGRSYTMIDAKSRKVEDILDSVRKGQCEAYGDGLTIQERLKKFWIY